MPVQSEHTRMVLTRAGYRLITVNEGFQRAPQASERRGRRPSLRSALEQVGGVTDRSDSGVQGRPAAKATLVAAIAAQGERLAATAYNFRDIAEDLAANKITVGDAQLRSRGTLVEMETNMAAVEYAAGRVSPELVDVVSRNHDAIREKAADSIGYLLDMDSPVTYDGDYTVSGFRTSGAEPLYDASRGAAEDLQVAAAQEIAASFLPAAAADLVAAFQQADRGDPDSMTRYHEAGKELFGVTRNLEGMERDLTGGDFYAANMKWAMGELDRVLQTGATRDTAAEKLWSAVDSFQGGFGLMVQNQPA